MESTACGLLKPPQACCHPWTNWMSVQQHQFRHMTFPPCTHQSHTICLSVELLHLYTTHSGGEMEVTDIPTDNEYKIVFSILGCIEERILKKKQNCVEKFIISF